MLFRGIGYIDESFNDSVFLSYESFLKLCFREKGLGHKWRKWPEQVHLGQKLILFFDDIMVIFDEIMKIFFDYIMVIYDEIMKKFSMT